MISTAESYVLAPDYRVRINGTDLPAAAANDVTSVAVWQDVDAPDMFTLGLVNWDLSQMKVSWADAQLFAEGNEVQISLGYANQLTLLLIGEITGLEPTFVAGEVPQLTVRGYDRGHRMLRGRVTRSFRQMTDSDIVTQIANERDLAAQVDPTHVMLDYVLQHNQTDMEFLLQRAQRIGYEIKVEDKTLHFRARQNGAETAATLTLESDLIEFFPRLSSLTQTSGVSVQGWDMKNKQAITSRAGATAQSTTMGGSTGGPASSANAFGSTTATVVQQPISSSAEADAIATARLNSQALHYVTGDGVCIGRTDLRAGRNVRIVGVGQRFSGLYFVTSTRHSYTPAQGYRTQFTFRRNAT